MPEIESNFETKRGLVKVYNAAINLLTHANEMWQSNPAIIKYFPGVFVLNIWQSACIISKLVHSSLASVLDITRGKNAYQNAVSLTFNASVLKYDMAYRSSGIMRSIWGLFANMHDEWKKERKDDISNDIFTNDFNLGITVKSRMAVSVFFDCLYILKEKCGMAKLKREMRRLQNYHDEEEEDEDYEDDDGFEAGKNAHHKKRISKELGTVKHPEKRAKRIIETIPLDPHPINAGGVHSSSASSTPSNNLNEIFSHKGSIDKISPRYNLHSSSSTHAVNGTNIKNNNNSDQNETPSITDDINSPSSTSIPSIFSIQQGNHEQIAVSYTHLDVYKRQPID